MSQYKSIADTASNMAKETDFMEHLLSIIDNIQFLELVAHLFNNFQGVPFKAILLY
jgi:hypothetical protein